MALLLLLLLLLEVSVRGGGDDILPVALGLDRLLVGSLFTLGLSLFTLGLLEGSLVLPLMLNLGALGESLPEGPLLAPDPAPAPDPFLTPAPDPTPEGPGLPAPPAFPAPTLLRFPVPFPFPFPRPAGPLRSACSRKLYHPTVGRTIPTPTMGLAPLVPLSI